MSRGAIRLIEASYDSGHRLARMGAGPAALIRSGLVQAIESSGAESRHVPVELEPGFHAEIAAAFELQRAVAREVRQAVAAGEFPLVLGGNCNTGSVGGAAGLSAPDLGVLWFDAHADGETPETTTSGFLDGMGLTMLQGRAWMAKLGRLEGFRPIPGPRILLIGARDVGDAEAANLDGWGVRRLAVQDIRRGHASIDAGLSALAAAGVRRLLIHVDADVHDPDAVAPANGYAVQDGLLPDEVTGIIGAAARAFPVALASLASFDPSFDRDNRVSNVMSRLAVQLVELGTVEAR
ncbi:MAG TPA: arginase family protein [Caulobacteraceae bacterium]|jgi:arginase